jgi:hypothetical protein
MFQRPADLQLFMRVEAGEEAESQQKQLLAASNSPQKEKQVYNGFESNSASDYNMETFWGILLVLLER